MTAMNHAGNEYAKRLAEAARTPEQHKVAPKVYFHRHNYAKFHFDFGIPGHAKTVSFANYRYITDDKREQDQLDFVADVGGTMIYTIPDSEVNAALEAELRGELQKDVFKTAQASSAAHGQQFDPNAPIVPVNVQHVGQMQGVAVVGMANSFSGTQATEGINAVATKASDQAAAPSAQSEALARLNAMTDAAKKQ